MRVSMKFTTATVAAAASSVLLLAPGATAAPRAMAQGEAVVNCVDYSTNQVIDGDNLAVLTPLDETVPEQFPAGTTKITCTNSSLSTETVYITITATAASSENGAGTHHALPNAPRPQPLAPGGTWTWNGAPSNTAKVTGSISAQSR